MCVSLSIWLKIKGLSNWNRNTMATDLIPRVKGVRDFYPEDWALQKWLGETCIALGAGFGYQEYEGPVMEYMDLYLGKTSEEIVSRQTFTLSGRDEKPLVLRPELTPTLARMVAQEEDRLVFPLRWQSYGRFYRYERPQRGRGRSFFQWNIDLLGSDTVHADAEIITIACELFKTLGLSPDQVTVKVNDRQGLECHLIRSFGLRSGQIRPLFAIVDRIDKMPFEKFSGGLAELGLDREQIDGLVELLESKGPGFSPRLEQVIRLLEGNGVSEYVDPDLKIVRGFDYYTGIVFEAWATHSLRRALFGGGRYDNLTLQVGGRKPVPGVGFAVGDMAITELLKESDLLDHVTSPVADLLVSVFSEDTAEQAASYARLARSRGLAVELGLNPGQRLDRQLKYAHRKGIPFVTIIGPDEVSSKTVLLKNLATGEQTLLPSCNVGQLAELIRHYRQL